MSWFKTVWLKLRGKKRGGVLAPPTPAADAVTKGYFERDYPTARIRTGDNHNTGTSTNVRKKFDDDYDRRRRANEDDALLSAVASTVFDTGISMAVDNISSSDNSSSSYDSSSSSDYSGGGGESSGGGASGDW